MAQDQTVATAVVDALKEMGVRYVFGVPSGGWVDYMEALRKTDGIEFILTTHEGGAGMMADVCGRLTGAPGACFGTFGPGATNLATGVGEALLDRSPVIALTDEMPEPMRGRTTQMGIDHQALFRPLTKKTTRLTPESAKSILFDAGRVALEGRPGPVHVGLPVGMSAEKASKENVAFTPPPKAKPADTALLEKAARLFSQAKKPLLAVGLGAVHAQVQREILKLAEKHKVPVVLTPMAKGMLSEDHPCYAGVVFHALSDIVGQTHQEADLVVAIGYDPVEFNYESWLSRKAKLISFDIEPADIDRKTYDVAVDAVGDIKASLDALLVLPPRAIAHGSASTIPNPHLPLVGRSKRRSAKREALRVGGVSTRPAVICDDPACENEWDFEALAQRRAAMFEKLAPSKTGFGPKSALAVLREVLPQDGIMTCDVGAHTHLIGQLWRTPAPGLQIMTNGWSTMGFGIPAAIAAKLVHQDKQVCTVVGDGGFLMTAGEIATAIRCNLHVVIVLLTDNDLALIRIKQEKKGNPIYGTPVRDKGAIGGDNIFGAPVRTAQNAAEFREALNWAFVADGPVIVEAIIDSREYDAVVLKKDKP